MRERIFAYFVCLIYPQCQKLFLYIVRYEKKYVLNIENMDCSSILVHLQMLSSRSFI